MSKWNPILSSRTCFVGVSLGLVCFVSELKAQVPAVPQAFPNNQTFTPGQLLFRQVGLGRITNIIYHNGNIYTNNVTGSDRRVWQWSNPNNIASLTNTLAQASGASIPLYNDHGNHAHTKVGDWFGGTFGMGIRRISPGVNGFGVTHPDWLGTPNDHQLYWPWSLAFNWIQYAADNNGVAFVRRRNEMLYQWDSLAQHGVTGNSILMGNLLIVTSDESRLGILTYDISPTLETPPGPPILLDKLSGAVGAYIAVLWQNYIVLSRRDTNTVDVVDWSDPTNLRFVTSIDVRGDSALNASSNVPYSQAQDEFIFTRRHKINMETLQTVLEFDEVGNNRPAGSVTGQLETSQYMMPMGQFLVTGSYSFAGRDGLGIWAHQAEPDTRAPTVAYHIPKDGQTHYPRHAPISILIHETLESYTMISGVTVIVRPVGGQPLDVWTSFSHDDVLTITPKEPLAANTTYEVVLPAGGIKDAAGNGIEGYSFTFSTGSLVQGSNSSPTVSSFTAAPAPATPGTPVQFTVVASDPEDDPMEYKFSFNDGSEPTEWTFSPTVTRTFGSAGHIEAKVQVRDLKPGGTSSLVTSVITLTVATAPTGPLPTHSAPIALDSLGRKVWTLNPDNDSVTAVDADTRIKISETDLAASLGLARVDPRSLARSADGSLWVVCHDADKIVVLSGADGTVQHVIDTGYGSAPIGIAVTPDGASALVTLEGRGASDPGNGQLVRYNTVSRAETGRLELGPMPRAIAIQGDGTRALVTRFISPENYGEVWEVSLVSSLSLTRTLILRRDRGSRGKDSASDGKGVPNYLAGITISPDNRWAWVTAKKDQTQRGAFFDLGTGINDHLSPDHTVRAMVARIDLNLSPPREPNTNTTSPIESSRIDVDNSESPTAVVFSPLGDYAFVALQGNNEAAVFDVFGIDSGSTRTTTWRVPAGAAPQGLLIDPTTKFLWVKNFMDRNLTVHDLSEFFSKGDRSVAPVTVSTVMAEKLTPNVLLGKQVFYHASNQMSLENYISCATCHVDGMHDGRTFDFTERGEGLRNTTDLRGRGGMGHGNVHWTANFDEIQDFILDITGNFGGSGFLPIGQIAQPPLGTPNAGRSVELDALAAYVSTLGTASLGRSPYRNFNGSTTDQGLAGAQIFQNQGCATCHPPSQYTDSGGGDTLRNVGTLRTSSGQRLGTSLNGIDTPSLLGVWAGAPFFHDGQAETLESVFRVAGGTILQAESASLSGGSSIPDFIDINWDSSSHGRLVQMNTNQCTTTFHNVNGGTGGVGALELRFLSGSTGSFQIVVNGSQTFTFPFSAQLTSLEWRRARIENVNLNAGNTNTIVVRNTGTPFSIDDLTVTRANELALAEPHRRVLGLSNEQRSQLLAYLSQLDGRDANGHLPGESGLKAVLHISPSSIAFGDGFHTVITLSSAGSASPNGPLTYQWTVPGAHFVQETNPNSPIAKVVLTGLAEVSVTLTVTDGTNASEVLSDAIPVTNEVAHARTPARAMFDEWVQRTTDLDGPLTDPADDPDGNGASLMREFVAGMPANSPVLSRATTVIEQDKLYFTVDRVRIAEGLVHTLEFSTNLHSWAPANGFTLDDEVVAPGYERWVFERNITPGQKRLFLRLRSELAPSP